MTNPIYLPAEVRELLERAAMMELDTTKRTIAIQDELRALLAQPAADCGLEVVAWQDAENPLYTTGEKRQMHGWATDDYPIVELVRKSDADARDAMRLERIAELEAAITSCLPCSYYMDLPDGGSTSLEEQLRRMAKDAADQRAAEHRLKEVASHCATVEQELASYHEAQEGK